MKFIKKNIKYIGIVMICIFCSYLTTIATNYIFDSSDVRFDNTGTSLESVNVQDAIDETFHHVTDYNEIKTTIGNSTLTTTNKTLIGGINEVNSNLGLPSSASGVTGADAFSKINTLNSNKVNTSAIKNNLTTSTSGYVLDARQGKALNDKIGISGTLNWYGVYPKGKDGWSNVHFCVPVGNFAGKTLSIDQASVMDENGYVVDIKSSLSIGVSNKPWIQISGTYNAAYAGWMVLISIKYS